MCALELFYWEDDQEPRILAKKKSVSQQILFIFFELII